LNTRGENRYGICIENVRGMFLCVCWVWYRDASEVLFFWKDNILRSQGQKTYPVKVMACDNLHSRDGLFMANLLYQTIPKDL